MFKNQINMEESILVCVYYGPNGEQLIRRGHKLAKAFNSPLYILTVDAKPFDELDVDKSNNIAEWKELAEKLGATAFILRDNDQRPTYKVIAEVAREKKITQIIIGQTARSRWEQIASESIINVLVKEIPFVDLHIITVARYLKNTEAHYQRGVRAYLVEEEENYRLIFKYTDDVLYEGIFFKEEGTDFNNGVFKFMKEEEVLTVEVIEDIIVELINVETDTGDDD